MKPSGNCICSAGWTSCPEGRSGFDCSTLDRCLDPAGSPIFCASGETELVRCHRGYVLRNETCAFGCKPGYIYCECRNDCSRGTCNAEGECVCYSGITGSNCTEGVTCSTRDDGTNCRNDTHSVTCQGGDVVAITACSGECSKSCGGF
jgi:hypothetical protein